ncbi:MAG: hypothetical protein PPHEINF_3517 [uncultured Paraburkholderia sp.]|nr:MAG: hypothetical protein PPHEINF_3517 [uncultured Paraburkholderia sp.]CAH2795602.1 MAG: hypothetical protein PPHEESC_3753 [uncultured Paraburkholderia sp.]CAH2929921.1 MAG: hypothetical protein PPHEMADMSA_3619 [uncultured Paraburkholderia sp.]CAH2931006.1 MAG: hypothetical protein PPHERAN_3626 [uncultured Paraburkholderia sp.]
MQFIGGSRNGVSMTEHLADDSVDAAILLFSGSANRTRGRVWPDAEMAMCGQASRDARVLALFAIGERFY